MIVGVDVSSHRIDLAWLEHDRPCRWHQELAKGHLIDRLRSIRVQWPTHGEGRAWIDPPPPGWTTDKLTDRDVTDIAIEYPFGRGNAIAALMATTGVITRQSPTWARVAWPSSGELRAAIGVGNRKIDAHIRICNLYAGKLGGWDEHELDSLVACIGWTNILAAQEEEPVELGHTVGARTPAHKANVGKDVTA